jgi:hypothetical protein
MTPQDHAKTLGLIYLAVGGLLSLLPFGFFVWLALVSDAEFRHSLSFTKWSAGGLLMSAGVLLLLLVTVSLALVGVGFLRHRRWVRLPALILCAPAVLSFPFGTGLAVYTWWFLHSEGGRRMFGKAPA